MEPFTKAAIRSCFFIHRRFYLTEQYRALLATEEVTVALPTRVECATAAGLHVVVYVARASERWPALVATTGSPRHVRDLRDLASRRGLSFRGWRLTESSPGTEDVVDLRGEADVYARLGLRFIPPETREGAGEVEDAVAV